MRYDFFSNIEIAFAKIINQLVCISSIFGAVDFLSGHVKGEKAQFSASYKGQKVTFILILNKNCIKLNKTSLH